jgi:asparagine N-glycosylation enzyme membrane subunit Stt3
MKASVLYRVTAGLLLLFAAGHLLGFRQTDPAWGVDAALAALRSIHFDVQGFHRTYLDFYDGTGFSMGVVLLFFVALAWQLGGLPSETLKRMRLVTWGFAACFVALTLLSWHYLFAIPLVFSLVISLLLLSAAFVSSR